MRPVAEPLYDSGHAASVGGKVGSVDLANVTQTDNLGIAPGACQQRLELLGGEVLCFVNDQKGIVESPSPHEAGGTDLHAGADQAARGILAPAGTAVMLIAQQVVHVVMKGSHPG